MTISTTGSAANKPLKLQASKSAHECINHGIKSIISVAAVICIILVGSFTAKALGYDIWDAIIVWTKDTFGFETNVNKPEPTPLHQANT